MKFGEINKKSVFLILLVFSFISFYRTLGAGFIWDDHQMIEENPYIKSITPNNIKHNFFSNVFNQSGASYYRPLQTLSYMFDFKIFKLNSAGWHGVNFFLHFANSFLLFILFGILNFSPQISLVSAIFFAVNPMVVEQMLIIAGRAEIMAFTFTLISLILYLKGGKRNLFLSFFSFILALFSKESGVITPLLIILSLWFLGKKNFNWKLLIYFLIIPFYLLLRNIAVNSAILEISIFKLTENLVLKMPFVISNYLYKTLLPFNLHSYNRICGFNIYSYMFLIIAAGGLIYLIFFKTKNKAIKFAFLWYLIALAPKLPLFGSQELVLDHWIYPSNAGFFLIAAYFSAKLANKYDKTAKFLIGFFILTWCLSANINILQRNTDLKIYKNAAKYKTSDKVYYNLSREYYIRGEFEKTREIMEKLIKNNNNEMFMDAFALTLLRTGNKNKAKNILLKIIKKGANESSTYLNLASIYVSEKKYHIAERILLNGELIFPEDEKIKIYLARIYNNSGRNEKSYQMLKRIMRFNPYNREVLLNLGIMEFNKKNYAKSGECFRRLLKMDKTNAVAKKHLKLMGKIAAKSE